MHYLTVNQARRIPRVAPEAKSPFDCGFEFLHCITTLNFNDNPSINFSGSGLVSGFSVASLHDRNITLQVLSCQECWKLATDSEKCGEKSSKTYFYCKFLWASHKLEVPPILASGYACVPGALTSSIWLSEFFYICISNFVRCRIRNRCMILVRVASYRWAYQIIIKSN